MQKPTLSVAFWAVLMLALLGCEKSMVEPNYKPPMLASVVQATAAGLDYGNSVFYLRANKSNLLLPVEKPSLPGTFSASPAGLKIDSVSGQIDMLQSETGMWFNVRYTGNDGGVLAEVPLMISGIEYASGIYTTGSRLIPYYNADTSLTMPAGTFHLSNGLDTAINRNTGEINLELLRQKLGAVSSPVELTVYYQLNDASYGASNRLRLRISFDITAAQMRVEEERLKRERPPFIIVVGG